ncbi:unnamed protein product [Caenorhabditis auriculariae]|uniref:UTP23 sensor motif region domain-containing protein n=1 Tax=Caenorhabditis auriculariae TaxID=2777116 RepID=A0A8S1H4T2_9PELO|nr:unnamed protein product [Caenorhabditis auriculariae]
MEQMSKYLGEETHIHTTKCVVDELEKFGPLLYGALVICKQFEVAPCPHNGGRSAAECIAHMARRSSKGKTKFFIATQDEELTEKLRTIPGTPILYIKYNAILLDKVSKASEDNVQNGQAEIEQLRKIKEELLPEGPQKKRKRKKGANPLSCKKKKVVVKDLQQSSGARTVIGKRRRAKKKSEDV